MYFYNIDKSKTLNDLNQEISKHKSILDHAIKNDYPNDVIDAYTNNLKALQLNRKYKYGVTKWN